MPELHLSQPSGLFENIQAFLSAVDFTEPFIISILTFHLILLLMTLCIKNIRFQQITFFLEFLLCISLSHLNGFLSSNWRAIAKQDYFDPQGIFLSVIVGVPLLLNCSIMLSLALIRLISELRFYARLKQVKKTN